MSNGKNPFRGLRLGTLTGRLGQHNVRRRPKTRSTLKLMPGVKQRYIIGRTRQIVSRLFTHIKFPTSGRTRRVRTRRR